MPSLEDFLQSLFTPFRLMDQGMERFFPRPTATPTPVDRSYPVKLQKQGNQYVPIPTRTPMPTRTPTPEPQYHGPTMIADAQNGGGQVQGTQTPTIEDIATGLAKFAQAAHVPDVPVATQAANLLEAGQGLPDPLLPTVLTLKETRGGLDLLNRLVGKNNPGNILPPGGLADYPSMDVGILGGGPQEQKGLRGVLMGPAYENYRNTGNLEDFFRVYSPGGPEHGNPSLEEQIRQYQALRQYFGQ